MTRGAETQIDLDALRHNHRHARRCAAGARVLAVVKADAYGHGAVPVARALAPDADAFGVATLDEALELRAAGIAHPILLLEGAFDADELPVAAAHGLELVVHDECQLRGLEALRGNRPLTAWLKVDSGMHRLGFAPAAVAAAHARLQACAAVVEVRLMTHFARADEPDADATRTQIDCFARATAGLAGARSLANSAALLAWPAARGDWVRPGIMLYGSSPFAGAHPAAAPLQPVMTLRSRIIALHDLAPGDAVGYGGRFRCERPLRVGTVALGYGDGYPRGAPDGTPVAVAGQRTRLVGRVSMDMLTVDCSGLDGVAVGSAVELWGATIGVDEVAACCDTIGYELLTRRPGRVPRTYVGRTADSG